MQFIKMHGLGNDYIYFDLVSHPIELSIDKWQTLAIRLSNRHTGIGGDGLVLILPPADKSCDFRMRIFNADGSEAEMCGNASRCIGKYIFEHGLTQKTTIKLETGAGVKTLYLQVENNIVTSVCVEMGNAQWKLENGINYAFLKSQSTLFPNPWCIVDIGNPHAVLIVEGDISDEMVWQWGPRIEKDNHFPNGTNVEFVHVDNNQELTMRVWERGSGETMACGTGACASAVAAYALGLTDHEVTVHLRGGDIRIIISEDWNVRMIGSATIVFDGEISVES